MSAPIDDLDYITAAGPKTLAEGCIAGGLHSTGVVDAVPSHAIDIHREFLLDAAADRFAISLPSALVVDGTTEYTGSIKAGRWVKRTLPAGRRLHVDPRYGLALLTDAVADLKRGPEMWAASRFDLVFERAVAEAVRVGGFGAGWASLTGSVVIAGGGCVRELTVRSDAADGTWLQSTWTFRWLDVPFAIVVPDPRRVIDEETYRREEEENAFR